MNHHIKLAFLSLSCRVRNYFQSLLLFVLLLASSEAFATHIIGGEINYECLGNNKYKILLTVYRDCYNGIPDFDMPAALGVFDVANNLIFEFDMTYRGKVKIPIALPDPCFSLPPNICVERTTYVDTLTLPFRAGGYQLVYQRCCRNKTINNIIAPSSTGATYYAYISEAGLSTCNRSAKFKNFPPPVICANYPIHFDHSATDADGDSLVYSLCAPLQGADTLTPRPSPPNNPPFNDVLWKSPYGINNILGGVSLKIDPHTGLLTGTPNTIGQFVVGICVSEYRKGKLISTTRRDFQYNVAQCGRQFVAAFFAPDIQCDGLTVTFSNQSTGATKYRWDFGVTTRTDDTSRLRNPTYTYADTGCYVIKLTAAPDSACRDVFTKRLCVQRTGLALTFAPSIAACSDTVRVKVTNASRDTVSTIVQWNWQWDGGPPLGGVSTLKEPIIKLSSDGRHIITLVATAKNGCRKTRIDTIQLVRPKLTLSDTIHICNGKSATLNPNGNQNYTYGWTPAATLDDPRKASPLATPTQTTTYTTTASLISFDTCTLTRRTTVRVHPTHPALNLSANKDTIRVGQMVYFTLAPYDATYTYTWLPVGAYRSVFGPTASAKPTANSLYIVTVRDRYGCTNADSVRVTLSDEICGEPYIFIPTAFSPNADGKNDVLFVRGTPIDELTFIVYNRWGEQVFESHNIEEGWDGNYKGQTLPPDVYGYYVRVKCLGGKTFEKKGNVTIVR